MIRSCAGQDMRLQDGMNGDKTSSDLDTDYNWFVSAAASPVVEADSTVSLKNGRSGSRTRRASNREFGKDVAEEILCKDFFQCALNAPHFSESEFELAFYMPHIFYERVRRDDSENNRIFQQNTDATENPGASTDLKLYVA